MYNKRADLSKNIVKLADKIFHYKYIKFNV